MANNTSESVFDSFAKYIDGAVKEAIGKAYNEALEEAHKQAMEKKDEVIAATALKMSSFYTMQDMGNTLKIEIVKDSHAE